MGRRGQRDVNLVDICLLGGEAELAKTLVLDILKQVVPEEVVYDGVFEGRVVFVAGGEARKMVGTKKVVREGQGWRGRV